MKKKVIILSIVVSSFIRSDLTKSQISEQVKNQTIHERITYNPAELKPQSTPSNEEYQSLKSLDNTLQSSSSFDDDDPNGGGIGIGELTIDEGDWTVLFLLAGYIVLSYKFHYKRKN